MQLLRGPKLTGEDKTGSTKRKSWGSSNTRRDEVAQALPFGLFLFLVESIRTFCGEAFFFIILETREVALLKDSSSSSSLVGCCFSTCFECLVVMLPVKRATSVLHDRNPSHPSLTHFIILVHWLLSTLLQIFLYYSCSAAASNLETFPLCLTADNDACLNHYQIFNFLKWFFGLVETKTWAKSRLAIFWIQFKC